MTACSNPPRGLGARDADHGRGRERHGQGRKWQRNEVAAQEGCAGGSRKGGGRGGAATSFSREATSLSSYARPLRCNSVGLREEGTQKISLVERPATALGAAALLEVDRRILTPWPSARRDLRLCYATSSREAHMLVPLYASFAPQPSRASCGCDECRRAPQRDRLRQPPLPLQRCRARSGKHNTAAYTVLLPPSGNHWCRLGVTNHANFSDPQNQHEARHVRHQRVDEHLLRPHRRTTSRGQASYRDEPGHVDERQRPSSLQQ